MHVHYIVIIVIICMLIITSDSLKKSWVNQDVKVSRCILWLSESIPFSSRLLCPHLGTVPATNVSSLKTPAEWMKENDEKKLVSCLYSGSLYLWTFFLRQGKTEIFFCSFKTWLLFVVCTENCNLFFLTERFWLLNSCQTCFYPITCSQGVESAVWHLGGKKP